MNEISENDLPNENIIAIDGTSGSGKSTIAKLVASLLDLEYLETGALYRGVTLLCLRNNIDVNDENKVLSILNNFSFEFDGYPVLNGEDISHAIKSHEVVLNVSQVSVHTKVRHMLTQIARKWIIEHNGGVVEGRDITTVVAPKAKLRCFVDAHEDVRAQRRQSDTKDNVEGLSSNEIKETILMRDKIDSTRKVAPLKLADGVIEIDTSNIPLEQNVETIVSLFKKDQ